MNRQTKLEVLDALLARVRARAKAPGPLGAEDVAAPANALRAEDAAASPADDAGEGPPSAPRLRESLSSAADEREYPEYEAPPKTPPPESGRQEVAAGAAAASSADELEMEISITVTEPVATQASEDEARTSPPRLSFVSEPEIELHVRVPAPVPAKSEERPVEAAIGATLRSAAASGEAGPSADIERPLAEPPEPDGPAGVAPARHVSSPPSVRLVAEGLTADGGAPPPPVEVWASTHAPPALAAQVASFVLRNAEPLPRSFGEILRATLDLGN